MERGEAQREEEVGARLAGELRDGCFLLGSDKREEAERRALVFQPREDENSRSDTETCEGEKRGRWWIERGEKKQKGCFNVYGGSWVAPTHRRVGSQQEKSAT